MAAAYLSAGSGDNSSVFTLAAGDTSVPNTEWANMLVGSRIRTFLDKTYTDLATFLAAAAASGLTTNVQTGTATVTNTFWTCAPAAKPVLNFAAIPAGAGYVRISLSYSASL